MPNNNGAQGYCLICKKSGMHEQNYMSYSSDNCFGKIYNQNTIKEGLLEALVNKADSVKHYKKFEHKWKRELKSLKNQNKIIFIIVNNSVSRRELNKIKNIRAKASKKGSYYISNISISDLDSESSLSRDSDWEEKWQPTEFKYINKLYHIVNYNIKKNKNQHNDAIKNDPRFDNKFSLSSGTKDLPSSSKRQP